MAVSVHAHAGPCGRYSGLEGPQRDFGRRPVVSGEAMHVLSWTGWQWRYQVGWPQRFGARVHLRDNRGGACERRGTHAIMAGRADERTDLAGDGVCLVDRPMTAREVCYEPAAMLIRAGSANSARHGVSDVWA